MDTMSSNSKRCNYRSYLKALFYGFITEYETPKIVMIHSFKITTLLRLIQIILLFYSVFYLLLYQRGYQKQDTSIISSVTLKVKGIGYVHTPKNQTYIFDGTDYIIPPSENNAIFIMTNFIQTEQSRSECTESETIMEAVCITDSDCQNKPYMPNVNGRWTGRCLFSSNKTVSNQTKNITEISTGLCEVQGWCPVENDQQESTVIDKILNFTIFIKNFIEFPVFNVKHKNIGENLGHCVYDPNENKDCPIFRLDYIINEAEKDIHERESMLRLGGVIRAKLDWNCNLDRNIRLCKPKYSFARLDSPFREKSFSVGFNFRFSSNWKRGRTHLRSLTKAYGLRLIISVSGKAGKFDFITLTLNIGSLVGIFGLATFFCDIILLNLTRKAALYRDYVFQRVQIDETRSNSVSRSMRDHSENITTIFENPHTYDQKLLSSFWKSESNGRISDAAELTHPSSVIDPSQLLRLQPSLGLTNLIN